MEFKHHCINAVSRISHSLERSPHRYGFDRRIVDSRVATYGNVTVIVGVLKCILGVDDCIFLVFTLNSIFSFFLFFYSCLDVFTPIHDCSENLSVESSYNSLGRV